MKYSVLFLILALSACTYDSQSLNTLTCTPDSPKEDGKTCEDGIWVKSTLDPTDMRLPDMKDMQNPPDMQGVDMPDMRDVDMPDMKDVDMPDMLPDMEDMPIDLPVDTPPDMPTVCSDSVVSPGEACDDGNKIAGDGCDANCAIETGWSCPNNVCETICGDGIIAGNEPCDDNNGQNMGCTQCKIDDGWTCNVPLSCKATCGDGMVVGMERCDDGARADGDGCNRNCQVETGWMCPNNVCDTICGDGLILDQEECDDDNQVNLDGCTACIEDAGWTCSGEPSRCSQDPRLGNGIIDGNEACDDGNMASGDGCDDQGQIELPYVCAVPGESCRLVTGASAGWETTPLPTGGGSGGSEFERRCPDGSFLVGMRSHIHGGNIVGETRLSCATVEVDNAGNLKWSSSARLSPFATDAGGETEKFCAMDEFVVGYKVHYKNNDIVRGFELECAKFTVVNGVVTTGADRLLSVHGKDQDKSRQGQCANGKAVAYVQGRAGSYLDRFTGYCSDIRVHQCGDGRIDSSNECDDANTVDGDGCSSTCEVEQSKSCSPGLRSTGAGAQNNRLVDGDTEPLWFSADTLVGQTPITAVVLGECAPIWASPFEGSNWIERGDCASQSNGTNSVQGDVYYHALFNLPANAASDAMVEFLVSADDTIPNIFVNMNNTNNSFNTDSFKEGQRRHVTVGGFLVGASNQLSIQMNNSGGHGGVMVHMFDDYFSICN